MQNYESMMDMIRDTAMAIVKMPATPDGPIMVVRLQYIGTPIQKMYISL